MSEIEIRKIVQEELSKIVQEETSGSLWFGVFSSPICRSK
jgi:hypothetical protein